ncbi:hypothetical protein NP233_g10733 [Leucocoprinus birnbaumii]|uniref:Uncharacterized protein n=1 Tax=Leucocoprinus birnbaumii TaxID=56174 RepID=A0AAD5VLF7_9AGAR|nr:hypothetical protein NP233_g10733 [Leucocoprinus birnbaumii]
MLSHGTIAVAIVKRQVMIVQASRTHTKRDKYIDVQTYSPFGERIFLASEVPSARIAASDILSVFNDADINTTPRSSYDSMSSSSSSSTSASEAGDMGAGMIELPPKAFSEYLAYSERQQKRFEDMWCAWTAKH